MVSEGIIAIIAALGGAAGIINIIKAIKMPEEVGTKKGKKPDSTSLKGVLEQWLRMKEASLVNQENFNYRKILGFCK